MLLGAWNDTLLIFVCDNKKILVYLVYFALCTAVCISYQQKISYNKIYDKNCTPIHTMAFKRTKCSTYCFHVSVVNINCVVWANEF